MFCSKCQLTINNQVLFDKHDQYFHGLFKGFKSCEVEKCLYKPMYNNKTRCAGHKHVSSKIEIMTPGECKKTESKIKKLLRINEISQQTQKLNLKKKLM
jgi:hypothetical protein